MSDLGFIYDDDRGNLTAVEDHLDNSRNKGFSYDSVNRLQDFNGSWGEGWFGYYDNGNRSEKSLNSSVNYLYEDTDRLTDAGKTYKYNDDGDMTGLGELTLEYDSFHRMKLARRGEIPLANYGYDGNGLRVYKTTGSTKIYLNGPGGNVLAELDGKGRTLAEYVYLNGALVAVYKSKPVAITGPLLLLLDKSQAKPHPEGWSWLVPSMMMMQ